MAGSPGLRGPHDRLDQIAPDRQDHRERQAGKHPGPVELHPALRHRFRRPAGAPDHSGTPLRLRGPLPPVHLHRLSPQRRPRLRPPEEIQEALRACILPMLKEGRTKRISKAAAEKAAAEKAVAEKSAEIVSEKTSELTPVTEPVTTG